MTHDWHGVGQAAVLGVDLDGGRSADTRGAGGRGDSGR